MLQCKLRLVFEAKIAIPSTSLSGRNNRLVLLDSEHRLQIFQWLRTTLMSFTTCCSTIWSRQQWP